MRITLRERRYQDLRANHFTPKEARMLSVLPRDSSARKVMVRERVARWDKFEKMAVRKQWSKSKAVAKWAANLARYYTKNRLRVRYGPVGNQPKMGKGEVNPWALYRRYAQQKGGPKGKGYVSPWEIRQLAKGKTKLAKGLIFVQKLEKQEGVARGVSKDMVRQWIAQKDVAVKKARGGRRAQLIIEKHRLERLL